MLNRYQGVFACLQAREVKYLVIGGIAAVLHGVPRNTFDVDILIETSLGNARLLLDCLRDAGLGSAYEIEAEELLAHEITIFRDRLRMDVMTRIPGVEFEDAWTARDRMRYGETEILVLSRAHLVASKLASGRPVDLADVASLAGDSPL